MEETPEALRIAQVLDESLASSLDTVSEVLISKYSGGALKDVVPTVERFYASKKRFVYHSLSASQRLMYPDGSLSPSIAASPHGFLLRTPSRSRGADLAMRNSLSSGRSSPSSYLCTPPTNSSAAFSDDTSPASSVYLSEFSDADHAKAAACEHVHPPAHMHPPSAAASAGPPPSALSHSTSSLSGVHAAYDPKHALSRSSTVHGPGPQRVSGLGMYASHYAAAASTRAPPPPHIPITTTFFDMDSKPAPAEPTTATTATASYFDLSKDVTVTANLSSYLDADPHDQVQGLSLHHHRSGTITSLVSGA